MIICYLSGDQKKTVEGDVANVVKYIALGLFDTACKAIMKAPMLSGTIKELVLKQMDDELEALCTKRKNGILHSISWLTLWPIKG